MLEEERKREGARTGLGNHEILPSTERITSVPVLRINARPSPPSAALRLILSLHPSLPSRSAPFLLSLPALARELGSRLMNRTQRNYVGASIGNLRAGPPRPLLSLFLSLQLSRVRFASSDRARKFNGIATNGRRYRYRLISCPKSVPGLALHRRPVDVDCAEKSNASVKRLFYARARCAMVGISSEAWNRTFDRPGDSPSIACKWR